MAIPRDPRTGMAPSHSPRAPFPFFLHASPKALTGPDLVARPKLISPMTPVNPINATKIKYGIKKEECICFGDQQNDIEMLKAAGTAYVMATGHPLAKKAADYVVESPLPVMQGLL